MQLGTYPYLGPVVGEYIGEVGEYLGDLGEYDGLDGLEYGNGYFNYIAAGSYLYRGLLGE